MWRDQSRTAWYGEYALQTLADAGVPSDETIGATQSQNLNSSAGASPEVTPFRIDIPQAALDDLRDRLRRTRYGSELPGQGRAPLDARLAIQHRASVFRDAEGSWRRVSCLAANKGIWWRTGLVSKA
jgi:hypothetical protein